MLDNGEGTHNNSGHVGGFDGSVSESERHRRKEILSNYLLRGDRHAAEEYISQQTLSEADVAEVAQEALAVHVTMKKKEAVETVVGLRILTDEQIRGVLTKFLKTNDFFEKLDFLRSIDTLPNLPPKDLKESVAINIKFSLQNGFPLELEKLHTLLAESDIVHIVKETLTEYLLSGYLDVVGNAIESGVLTDAEIKTEENRKILQEQLVARLLRASNVLSDVDEILSFGILTNDDIRSEEVVSALKDRIVSEFSKGNVSIVVQLVQLELATTEVLQSKEVKHAATSCLIRLFTNGDTSPNLRMLFGLGIVNAELKQTQEVRKAAKTSLILKIKKGHRLERDVLELSILSEEEVHSEEIQNACKDTIVKTFENNNINFFKSLVEKGLISTESIQSVEVCAAAKARLLRSLTGRHSMDIDSVIEIKSLSILSDDEFQSTLIEGLEQVLSAGWIDEAINIIKLNLLTEGSRFSKEACSKMTNTLVILLSKGDFKSARKVVESVQLEAGAVDKYERIVKLGPQLCLSSVEYGCIATRTVEELAQIEALLQDKESSKKVKRDLHKEARAMYTQENDPGSIIRSGFTTLETRGIDDATIWAYLEPDGDRHRELQNVPTFFDAVPNDKKDLQFAMLLFRAASRGTGMQKQMFIKIMADMTPELWSSLRTESQYPDQDPPLSDLGDINLIRISNEIRLYQTPELLDAIKNLPAGTRLRRYAFTLLSHPTINVEAITQFVKDPKSFFGVRTRVGEFKGSVTDKILTILEPDNTPGDWNSNEARDAIVEGTYDRLNGFDAKTVTWREIHPDYRELSKQISNQQEGGAGTTITFLRELFTNVSSEAINMMLQEARKELFLGDLDAQSQQSSDIREAVFSHMEKNGDKVIEKTIAYYCKNVVEETCSDSDRQLIASKLEAAKEEAFASNTPSIFWRVVAKYGFLDNMPLHGHIRRISGSHYDTGLPNETSYLNYLATTTPAGREVMRQTIEHITKFFEEDTSGDEFEMAILAPSDPEVATAGSTTGNCDAFGNGKKAHYMINPATAQLLLRRNGKVVAQSTLVIGRKFFETGEERGSFLRVFAQTGRIGVAIEKIYSVTSDDTVKKIQTLLEQYAAATNIITLDSVEVPPNGTITDHNEMQELLATGIAQLGKADTLFANAEVRAGTLYSFFNNPNDALTADNVDIPITPLAYTDNLGEKNVVIQQGKELDRVQTEPRLRPAHPTDAFAVALMEEIAYRRSGGEHYVTGYLSMTSGLWESTVSAEHRGHNPLSFITHDDAGVPTGYLIAYSRSESEIYITDTATTEAERGVGRRLLMALLESCATDVQLNNKNISMDCRGETSAKAIAKNKDIIQSLEFEAEGYTVTYTVEGPNLEDISGDSLYPFRFLPHVS